MRRMSVAAAALVILAIGVPPVPSAQAQGVTVPVRPSDNSIPSDVIYPDAVTCNVTTPAGIEYDIIFYKSQIVSFAHEANNEADYGTPFIRDPDHFDASTAYRWHLQLGKPGDITVFALPQGWTTDNCQVGKSISELNADKQTLKLFAPE